MLPRRVVSTDLNAVSIEGMEDRRSTAFIPPTRETSATFVSKPRLSAAVSQSPLCNLCNLCDLNIERKKVAVTRESLGSPLLFALRRRSKKEVKYCPGKHKLRYTPSHLSFNQHTFTFSTMAGPKLEVFKARSPPPHHATHAQELSTKLKQTPFTSFHGRG